MEEQRAADVVITLLEMERMWRSNREGYEESLKQYASMTSDEKQAFIQRREYGSLEEYTKKVMNDFATVSHGDVVLVDGGRTSRIELKRVRGKFSTPEDYRSLNDLDKNTYNINGY